MRRVIAVIPARMASTRFPGKPLVPILGLPMIEHVRRRVGLTEEISEVMVATCDEAIAEVVRAAGGTAVLTSPEHERCTDRVAEAASGLQADIVVNVQGDEPCVRPEMLKALIAPLIDDPSVLCTNLMSLIDAEGEFDNPDVVKVVADRNGNALYFSREPIPSRRKSSGAGTARFKQLGIIAFRSDFLQTFARLEETPLEAAESVDMMRAVEHGYPIRMVPSLHSGVGVDRLQDIARASAVLRDDPLVLRYWVPSKPLQEANRT